MAEAEVAVPRRGFGETTRPDAWWVPTVLVFLVLSGFVVYATWAALQGAPVYDPLRRLFRVFRAGA